MRASTTRVKPLTVHHDIVINVECLLEVILRYSRITVYCQRRGGGVLTQYSCSAYKRRWRESRIEEFTAIRLAEVAGEASLDVDTLAYDAVRAALNKKHAHNWEDGFRACNNYGTSALSYY